MTKIDVFAHVLPEKFYKEMLEIDSTIPKQYPFIKQKELLSDIKNRRTNFPIDVKQVISAVNVNPEDYVDADKSAKLCIEANKEISNLVSENGDLFTAGIAMLPMNNIDASLDIMKDDIAKSSELIGIQLFTRALGKSIADTDFLPIFETASKLDIPILLHPVFDSRKPDNNIVFSWEYELSQAMLQIVQAGIFQKFPNLKIIVHHAGAMIPFFAGRIDNILPPDQAEDFKKFYVDTAILGNTKALELAVSYFGADHMLFGTDAPFGIPDEGDTEEIISAINEMKISDSDKELIYQGNFEKIFGE
ncbi:amidohydrolase family protein [Companilactobacillus metriopterae]|uniref:amidohydrolase family protein n=1 Tax=Companilactobacillus metriopterae TaxID=1909267 RepID=UPI00100B119D|nr:amidohydrolase family protein [Companilactobacillus metriopterae]